MMHGVLITEVFERQARRYAVDDDELSEIIAAIAKDPLAGDLIKGAGGARKMRHRGRGHGKSGGYRTIHYFCGDDLPIFLLTIYSKGDKVNLTKAERNDLGVYLPQAAAAYRSNK